MRFLFPILAVSVVLTSCGLIPIPLVPVAPPIMVSFATDGTPSQRGFSAECTAIEISEPISGFRQRVDETNDRFTDDWRRVGDFYRQTSIQATCFKDGVANGTTVANVHRKLRLVPGPNVQSILFISSCGLPVVQSAQIISKTGNCPPNIAVR